MPKLYRVNNIQEALSLALKFRADKKYDLFRGQAQNWPVVSSISRLSPRKLKKEHEKLNRYLHFLSTHKSTQKYLKNGDWLIAVAQHYGLATSFIDFTKNPAIALFFATNSMKNQVNKECVLICLNKNDFIECVNMFADIFTRNEINRPNVIEVDVDNLWRLQTQEGCFLECSIQNLEESFYSFDKIVFPYEEAFMEISADKIYPKSKSELEILLDQYFAGEYLIKREIEYHKNIKKIFPDIKITKIKSESPYRYVKTRKQHNSWNINLIRNWHYSAVADYEEKIPLTLILDEELFEDHQNIMKIINDLVHECFKSSTIQRINSLKIKIEYNGKKNNYLNDIVSRNISNIWDGMRPLPYTDIQIQRAISKYLFIEISSFKIKKEEDLFINSIQIEMASRYGIHNRCSVSKIRVAEAIRCDIADVLINQECFFDNTLILLYINKPRVVFDFTKLVLLFAEELIASQMYKEGGKKQPIVFFSPVDLDIFGYA